MLEVSRVTVRKSLEILEDDGLIVRQVGRGTTVTLRNRGNKSELDMIVLIAPARNPFFAEFIGRFQNYAETQGALLLYVEKPRMEELENCLYRLYKRGLRNAVVWLEDLPVDVEKLRRLRALGMNMVFFDSDKALPYADCVALDNALAIRTLYGELKKDVYKRQDQRSAGEIEKIYQTVGKDAYRSVALNSLSTGFLISSLMWVKEHEPENYEKIHTVMFPKDYIRYRMCGELGTDMSDASSGAIFDTRNRQWAWELIEKLGMNRCV